MNIDHIAREMVDVEPSSDLEARIRGRIRAERHDDRAAWWTWRVAAPFAAMAAIALVLIIGVPGTRSPEVVDTLAVRGSRTLPAEVQSAKVDPVVISSPAPQFPSSSVARVRTSLTANVSASKLSDAELAWMDRRMPALDPVNALQVEHLRVESIQPEPLAITPLTMTPVGTDGAGIERRNDR